MDSFSGAGKTDAESKRNNSAGHIRGEIYRWKSKFNDQILALVLLHDSMLWVCWCHTDYVLKFYKILDNFGFKDPSLEFHSYRKQKALVSPDKDVFISYYKLKNKAMAVVVNRQNTPRMVKVNIDWKKLGIPSGAALKDARTGKVLPSADSLTLKIPGYNFALIQIGK